jgi:hydrogenase maturation protease
MKTRLLVIGYGNELRHDDGVGPRVGRAVAAWQLPGVEAVVVHQLTPEMAERVGEAESVVFVDAGPSDVVQMRRLEPSCAARVLGHTGEPRELLALAEALYGHRPKAWLVTLPAPELGFGEGLSAAAEHGLAEALRQVGTLAGATEEPRECTRSA